MPRTRAASRPAGRKEIGRPSRGPAAGRRHRSENDLVADLRDGAGADRLRVASARRRLRRTYSESAMPPAVAGTLGGLTSALGSLLVVLVVVVLGWVLAGDHSSLGSMLDLTANGWLAVHLLPVEAGGELIWVPPLALTALLVVGARLVGVSTVARAGAANAGARWRIVLAGVVVYATTATVVAALAATADAGVPIFLVPLATGAVFGLGFGLGVARGSGGREAVLARMPGYLVAEARAALAGLLVLVAGSAVVLVAAVFGSIDRVRSVAERLHPGISGTLLLGVIALLLLPTALVWSASFVLGAGFSVGGGYLTGEGTIIAPWGVRPTQMPDFPPLAAVPTTHTWWYAVVLVVPLLAAFAAARRAPAPPSPGFLGLLASRLRIAGAAAAVAGVAAALAHVTLGGRLSGLGPAPLLVAGAVLAWFAAGLLIAAGAVVLWRWACAKAGSSAPATPEVAAVVVDGGPAEVPAAESADASAETAADESADASAETAADESADASAETAADEPADASAETAADEPADGSTEPADEPAAEPVGQPTGKESEMVSLALGDKVPVVVGAAPGAAPLGDPGESETVVLDPPVPSLVGAPPS